MKVPPNINIIKKEMVVRNLQGRKFPIPLLTYTTKGDPLSFKVCADRTALENSVDFENPTWRSNETFVKMLNERVCT